MLINDFIMERKIDADIIEKYRSRVSDEIIEMWNEYGEGSFCNGYFRIVNPDDYAELLQESYFKGAAVVPLFVTSFGDVIVYDEDYVTCIYFREHDFRVMNKGLKLFFRYLKVDGFKNDYLDIKLYEEAKEKFGALKSDESYCFVPILPLGGKKNVKNLEIGKTREHIELITQMAGGVGMS